MLAKRLAALLGVGLVAGLLLSTGSGSNLAAQDKKDTPPAKKDTVKKKDDGKPKDDPKTEPKDDGKDDEDILPKIKGTTVKIVKVDKEKKTFEATAKGKKTTYTVGDKVEFIGPRGGKDTGNGFEDDRFVVGRKVKLVMDGAKLTEIHFDFRPRKDAKPKPKTGEKD